MPGDRQFTAARADAHGGVKQAAQDAGHGGGAGARAARQGFARAPFIHAQFHVMAVDDLQVAGVDPAGKARVVLDQRARLFQVLRIDIVDHLHGMRVAHRDDGHQDGATVARQRQVQRPQGVAALRYTGEASRIERHQCRFQHRRAHVDRDAAVKLQARRNDAGHGFHADARLA